MGAWVDHDLSAFIDDSGLFGGSPTTQFSSGALSRLGGSFWRFALPSMTLGPTDVTEIEVTYGSVGQTPANGFNISLPTALDALSGATFDGNSTLGSTQIGRDYNTTTPDNQVYTLTVGPGIYIPDDNAGDQANFDTYVATGLRPYVLFRQAASSGLTTIAGVRARVTNDAAPDNPEDDGAFLFAPPQQFALAPLRVHPRDDGLGTSSAPRIWPPSRSVQASPRRAGGYL